MAVLRSDVGCGRQRRAATGVRRCTLAAWRMSAAAARIGARSFSTVEYVRMLRTSALFDVGAHHKCTETSMSETGGEATRTAYS